MESCTGLQDNEKDLREFLNQHLEYDKDIFEDEELGVAEELNARIDKVYDKLTKYANGGKGSGNFGHTGRETKLLTTQTIYAKIR